MRRYRSLSAVVSAIAVSALVGGLFGRRLLADDKVSDHYKAFTAALSAVEASYVEKIDSDRLVYGAVRGMLSTLDPHSSFYDPREYAQMRERQEGHYYGIGIQISAVDGEVIAQLVFEGSPSYKQGIRQGDVLAKIAGEDTKSWNCATPSDCTERAMKKLRGARGTPVQISLRRRGYKELIPVELVRDEITIPTVPAAFMIDQTTGYVQLRDFGETTDRDLRHAPAAAGYPQQPRRPSRPGHQGRQRVHDARQDDRLHARPHREFRSGLPCIGRRRVHQDSDCDDGEPQQRQRF
jgi:carboxyl-terminal processing protease